MTWPAEHGTSKKQWPRPLQCMCYEQEEGPAAQANPPGGGGGRVIVSHLLFNAWLTSFVICFWSSDDRLAFCTTQSFWMLSSAASTNVAGDQVPVEHVERFVVAGNAVMVNWAGLFAF